MRFEPRIVRADDEPNGSLKGATATPPTAGGACGNKTATSLDRMAAPFDPDLPEDLQWMADQLTSDAHRLADCYLIAHALSSCSSPALSAGRGLKESLSARGRFKAPEPRHRLIGYAAAAILLVACGGWLLPRQEVGERAPLPALTKLTQAQPDKGSAIATDALPSLKTSDTLEFSPAMLLENLTGPEREGLLDLLEEGQVRQPSLSI